MTARAAEERVLELQEAALRSPAREQGREPDQPQNDGPRSCTMRELLAKPANLQPPLVIAPRFAWQGRTHVLAGREKAGKSTLAAAIAAAVSNGGPFLGEATAPGLVLWASAEEHPADLCQRAVEFGTNPDSLRFLTAAGADPLATLRDEIAAVRPVLVIGDSLETWHRIEDGNASSSWVPVMNSLTATARTYGCAMLWLHHSRKSDGGYRGSSAVGAGCDVITEMAEPADAPTARTFRSRGRIRDLEPFTLTLDGATYQVTGGGLSLDARVLATVQGAPGISRTALRVQIGGRAASVDGAVNRLVERGAIRDVGGRAGHAYTTAPPCPTLDGGTGFGTAPLSEANPLQDNAGTGFGTGGCPVSETPGVGNGTGGADSRGDAWEPDP